MFSLKVLWILFVAGVQSMQFFHIDGNRQTPSLLSRGLGGKANKRSENEREKRKQISSHEFANVVDMRLNTRVFGAKKGLETSLDRDAVH